VRRVWIATAIFLGVSALLDFAIRGYAHPEFWWHTMPGFDLLYGFVGCGAIVFFSKWLGHRFLMRSEDYYERDR
jgi:hypothetical protein